MAQCVCPGLFTGLKFNLNSEDRAFIIEDIINFNFDLDNQKILGNHKIVIQELIQFKLRFNHKTLGSKIENKLDIILGNRF